MNVQVLFAPFPVWTPPFNTSERRITVAAIQARVAEFYGLSFGDMKSPRRARKFARPRQVAMYLARHLTPQSMAEIGRRFGGRDHTTVLHAIRAIEALRLIDGELDADVTHLKSDLGRVSLTIGTEGLTS